MLNQRGLHENFLKITFCNVFLVRVAGMNLLEVSATLAEKKLQKTDGG